MFKLIATILSWFYEITGNYALAIALLTMTVMVLLTPLTLKGTRSMIQMQRLQPQIKKIQSEFKGDRQRLNEELMKFYQENKINPLGGCLPLLIQAPVFIVLYRTVHKLTEACSADNIVGALAGKGNSRCLVGPTQAVSEGTFGPSYLDHGSKLFKDLVGQTKMVSFSIDLSRSTVQQLQKSFVEAIPFLSLILLVGITSWYQQRQMTARTKGQPSAIPAQQQAIMKFLPFIWPIFLLTLPTGLAVYALVSNLYRIAQNAFITRTLYKGASPAGGVIEVGTAKPAKDPSRPVVPPKAKNRPAPTGKGNPAPPPKPAPNAKADKVERAEKADKSSSRPEPRSAQERTSGSLNRPTPKPKPKPTGQGNPPSDKRKP